MKSVESRQRIEGVLKKTMSLCPVGVLYERAGVKISTELIIE